MGRRRGTFSLEFGCSFGSREYEARIHAAKMRGLYGLEVLDVPRRCRLCSRKSSIIHIETGLTMQCFQTAQVTGRACDGSPMFELMKTRDEHLATEAAAARDTKLRTPPAQTAGPGPRTQDLARRSG